MIFVHLIKPYLWLTICLLYNTIAFSQYDVKGVVLDDEKQPLVYANIRVLETNQTSITNTKGEFLFSLPKGVFTLKISNVGYKKTLLNVTNRINTNTSFKVILEKDNETLNVVTIKAKTKAEKKRNTAYAVNIIENKEIQNLSRDVNQILNTSTGINIRNTGGLGSNFRLFLNGFSGRQIRFFKDGIPIDQLGSTLRLNNFPVLLISSIEIYKGVVPLNFSTDALGGVINLVSENRKDSYVDVGYSFGDFNTHRISLNSQWYDKKTHRYLKLNSFFNHSDNNYRMIDVPVFDLKLGNNLGTTNTNRFNDQYTSAMVETEFGIYDKKIADQLAIKFTYARNKNNRQHPDLNILRPLGDFFTEGETFLINGIFKKEVGKLKTKAYISLGTNKETTNDSSIRKFNWLGNYIVRTDKDPFNPKGEVFERRSIFELKDLIADAQVHADFEFIKNQHIQFTSYQNHIKREGNDRINSLNRAFSKPAKLSRFVSSIGYSGKFIDKKVSTTLFYKYYDLIGNATTPDTSDRSKNITTNISNANNGYGALLAISPIQSLTLKASYEKAFRLPDSQEILGDGVFTNPNPQLNPETSDNWNTGFRFNHHFDNINIILGTNFFLRNAKNFIRFAPLGPFGNFINLADIKAKGAEIDFGISLKNTIRVSGNITIQDITEQNRLNEGLLNTNYLGKVPNIPSLFANAGLSINPFRKKLNSRLKFYCNTRFIDEFYLFNEKGGDADTKNIIPYQLTHQFDAEYTLPNKKWSFSYTISNLTDQLTYDNFRIQNPGRAFYLKVRYSINNKTEK